MKVDLIYIKKCWSGKSWIGMPCWFQDRVVGEDGHDEDLTGDVAHCGVEAEI